jgi:hypothetical protein
MRGSAKPQNPVQLWDSPLNCSNVKSYFVALGAGIARCGGSSPSSPHRYSRGMVKW